MPPSAKVREPIPSEDALHRDDQILAEGCDGLQENDRVGGKVSVKQRRSCLVEHAGVHAPCMEVDAAVMLMGYVVKSHQALSFRGKLNPLPSVPSLLRVRGRGPV